MKERFSLSVKHLFLIYILISFVVYLELYLSPSYYLSRIHPLVPLEVFKETVLPVKSFIFFALLLACFLFRKPEDVSSRPVSVLGPLPHIISLTLFILYLKYVLESYPFRPIDPGSVLIRIIQIFNDEAVFLMSRFRIGYIFLSIVCHGTLFLVFFRVKNIIGKYLGALGLGFLLSELTDILRFTAPILVRNIAYIETWMLKLSGIPAWYLLRENMDPVIATNVTRVSVAYGCSGLNGIELFCFTFILLVLFDWNQVDKRKALVLISSGVMFMIGMNLARIYIIIVIGHLTGEGQFMSFFHDHGGMVLYFIGIYFVYKFCYKWILLPKVSIQRVAQSISE